MGDEKKKLELAEQMMALGFNSSVNVVVYNIGVEEGEEQTDIITGQVTGTIRLGPDVFVVIKSAPRILVKTLADGSEEHYRANEAALTMVRLEHIIGISNVSTPGKKIGPVIESELKPPPMP